MKQLQSVVFVPWDETTDPTKYIMDMYKILLELKTNMSIINQNILELGERLDVKKKEESEEGLCWF